MASLILAALFFVAIHLGVSGTRLRDRLVARIGERLYLLLFSLASAAAIAWLASAYAAAPYAPTWGLWVAWKWAALPLMLLAALLVAIGLWRWIVGVAAYALLIGAHRPLIGISPFP